MRTLRKRLVCTNRHDSSKNNEAIAKVAERYIEKMKEKGWVYIENKAYPTAGNAYFQYEMYITLYKPNPNSQKDLDLISKWQAEEESEKFTEYQKAMQASLESLKQKYASELKSVKYNIENVPELGSAEEQTTQFVNYLELERSDAAQFFDEKQASSFDWGDFQDDIMAHPDYDKTCDIRTDVTYELQSFIDKLITDIS